MREECEVMLPGGICGKPAVDSIHEGDDRSYLCAQHWDELQAEDEDEDDWASDVFEDDDPF